MKQFFTRFALQTRDLFQMGDAIALPDAGGTGSPIKLAALLPRTLQRAAASGRATTVRPHRSPCHASIASGLRRTGDCRNQTVAPTTPGRQGCY